MLYQIKMSIGGSYLCLHGVRTPIDEVEGLDFGVSVPRAGKLSPYCVNQSAINADVPR